MLAKKFVALIIVCAIISYGVSEYKGETSVDMISMDDALYDYDYMWHILENNYPFLNMAERKYLLSTEKLKENFRKEIERLGTENIEFCQYYEILQECIGNLQELGHLTILTPDSYDYFSRAVEEYSSANSLEPWINWQAELLHSQKVEERYSYLKRTYSSGAPERDFSQKSNLIFRDVTENVGYIKINSFEEKYMKNDREDLRKWFLQNAYKEYIT